MDQARAKVSALFGLSFTDTCTNAEVLEVSSRLRAKNCTMADLGLALGLARNTLSRRISNTRKALKPLSGLMRERYLKAPFDVTVPCSTTKVTKSTALSSVVEDIQVEAQRAATSEMIDQLGSKLKEEKTASNVRKMKHTTALASKKDITQKYARLLVRYTRNSARIQDLEKKLKQQRKDKRQLQQQLQTVEKQTKATEKQLQGHTVYAMTKVPQEHQNNAPSQTVEDLEAKIYQLNLDVKYLQTLLNDDQVITTTDDITRAFNSRTTQCVMNLLSRGVGVAHVGPVMQEVADLCGKTLSALPSVTTVNRMADRRASLSRQQISETVSKQVNTTLMSDETRKRGESYEVFALQSAGEEPYVLGLRDMADKSAHSCLSTLKTILGDYEETASSEAGKRILSNLKNTMSDRAASEKKFHKMLEKYRLEILPQVHENWQDLHEEEKEGLSQLNNFYCGLHLLVNFAELADKTVKTFESMRDTEETQRKEEGMESEEDEQATKEESGAVLLVRQASKCLSRGGDERNGCFQDFRTYLLATDDEEETDENKVGKKKLSTMLVPFRGNRFNILFYNSEVVFYLHPDITEFFRDVHPPTNGLQRAVFQNLGSHSNLAVLKALGLCSKIVTSPFWRILETKGTTLEQANEAYAKLFDFLREAKEDPVAVVSGDLAPFPDLISKDDIYKRLMNEDPFDTTTCSVLQVIFQGWFILLAKAAADHLPGGKFALVTPQLAKETASVPTHNKFVERVFGMLDTLTRYRPAASTLCNESFIMFSLNKTAEWMQHLPETTLKHYMDKSRKEGRSIRAKYRERLLEIETKRRDALLKKRAERKRKEQKKEVQRLDIYNSILYYGLWQSHDQVDHNLQTMSSAREKKEAIKAQLQFRKIILEQKAEGTLFALTVKKKNLTIQELSRNVKTLIDKSLQGPQPTQRSVFAGKKITHYQEVSGVRTPFAGTVVSSVPGYPDWHNVTYENDEAVYVYKLQDDMDVGDVEIVQEKSAEAEEGAHEDLTHETFWKEPTPKKRKH